MCATDVSLLITIPNNNFGEFKMCWPTAVRQPPCAWCPQETLTSMTMSNTSGTPLIIRAMVCILINSYLSNLLDGHLLDTLRWVSPYTTVPVITLSGAVPVASYHTAVNKIKMLKWRASFQHQGVSQKYLENKFTFHQLTSRFFFLCDFFLFHSLMNGKTRQLKRYLKFLWVVS